MKLFCDECQQITPHTERVRTSAHITNLYKICKRCASLNRDPTFRFQPASHYGQPRYTTIEEALRLYKQRGVQRAERLFPNYTGPRWLSLEAFFKQEIEQKLAYQRFRPSRGNLIEIHRCRLEPHIYTVYVWQDKEVVEQHMQELDQKALEHFASLVQPDKPIYEIKGYIAEWGL